MEEKLDLNHEVKRLLRWKGEDKGVYVDMLSHKEKIEILADGVIEGWYGDYMVRRKILKNYYDEVQNRVYARSNLFNLN